LLLGPGDQDADTVQRKHAVTPYATA
jgi:hypothetical protein